MPTSFPAMTEHTQVDSTPVSSPPPAAPVPDPIPPKPVPEATVPPPQPPPNPFNSLVPRAYMPRAFGFTLHSLFVEATLYHDPRDRRMINADGRFISDGADSGAPGEWTYFESLDDLGAKTHWSEAQMGRFTERITKLMNDR